jgi:NitT/TauT family transport system substrate-binding protein
MDQGFYKEEGIDITIKEGTGGTMSLKLVGAGGGETFGICGTNVAVKGVAQDVPVIQIMTIESSKMEGILSRPEAGIREPKDLIGKSIGGTGAGTSDIFDAFLAANNLPPEKLTFVNVGQGRDQALVTGKIDAGLGTGMNLIHVLKKLGLKSPQVLKFADWGLPDYGDGVITHLDTYKKNPDLIRRFVKASIRGINHTFMEIEKAADIAVKHFPMTDKATLLTQLKTIRPLIYIPVGWQDPKVIEALRDINVKFGGLPEAKNIPLNKFFTNEFLPKY